MTATTVSGVQPTKVGDVGDRQAFDARRSRIREHLPASDVVWKWAWLASDDSVGPAVLERLKYAGHIERVSALRSWEQGAYWRVTPSFWKWCVERYGGMTGGTRGIEMLVDPVDVPPGPGETSGKVKDAWRSSVEDGVQVSFDGENVNDEIGEKNIQRDAERREQCGAYAHQSDLADAAEQLTVEQALAVADTRQAWREFGMTLPRPRGDAYPDSPVPAHIDAATG